MQPSASRLSHSVAFRRDDSTEDLAARVQAADAEVARARAEQKTATDRLAREEAALTRGVASLSLRPADWLAVKAGEPLARRRTSGSVSSQGDDAAVLAAGKLMPEVVAYNGFIGSTGAHGGWHPQEAADFDRAIAAARGNYSHAIRICADTLPTLGEDEIRAHACWHRQAVELAAGKQHALDRWRAARRAAREAAAATGSDDPTAADVRAAAEAGQDAKRRSTREAVAQWRAKKAAEDAAEAAAEAEAAQQQAAAERDRWHVQQQQRRASLQLFLSEKEAQAAAAAQAAEEEAAARRPALSQQALERVRARQEISELKQRAALEEAGRAAVMKRERKARLKQQLAASVVGEVRRDSGRLLQPTAAARKRVDARRTIGSIARDSGYIRHISRRGTADWAALS